MTDQEILSEIQYALMEPPDLGVSFPSGLWSPSEVLDRMNERQNRFLKEAQLLTGIATLPIAVGVGTIALPDDWLWTQAVLYRGDDGAVRELLRADQFQADHAQPGWTTTAYATPAVYFDVDPPVLRLSVSPVATQAGVIDLYYIPSGSNLDGTGEALSVPDEFAAPAVKYGALADLLNKDGRGRSPERAAYCEERFSMGVAVAELILKSSWVG